MNAPPVAVEPLRIAVWSELSDREPSYALAGGVDLVVTRFDDSVSVLYGRCLHRGALMSDGTVRGENLVCGVHGWDYRLASGVSAYNAAEALLLPSLNEGFGMPALEAMGCGTPVIGSAIDALTEVVGEAGLLVDPPDRDNLAAAMRRVLDDSDLRAELRVLSLARAARFSWADAGERTLQVYREVAGE